MWALKKTTFDRLPNWAEDNHLAALNTFARQSLKPKDVNYRQGLLGIPPDSLSILASKAESSDARAAPRAFFESNFDPYTIETGSDQPGQVTGFYEPVVNARRECDRQFSTPIYARPPDLVAINNENRPAGIDQSYRFGRQVSDGVIEAYFDRSQINAGAISKTTAAIAFLEDPIEAFFIHIQGAARLELQDGTTMRITYDGKSGHPFTAIGKLLVQRKEIDAKHVSMQNIKKWLRSHPEQAARLMEENKSYIFFKQSESTGLGHGPIAAAKVPLTTGRSLAVDRLIHTFGTPIFVNAESVNGDPFSRLMIAQETGSAIVGPTRGDIFFGSGEEAGEAAGAVNSKCEFTVLVPKDSQIEISGTKAP